MEYESEKDMKTSSKIKIILASQSPRRKRLLEGLGIEFEVRPAYADEESIDEKDHIENMQKTAMLKVDIIAEKEPEAIIIGADSMIIFNDERIGKPKDVEDAVRILKMISGNTHQICTGLVVKNTKTQETLKDYSITKVKFRELTEKEIIKWANNPDCLTGAGAYTDKVHHYFFEKMDGSHTNVWGLPMEKLIPMLRKMKVNF